MFPPKWDTLTNDLHGDVEAFIRDMERGNPQREYERRVNDNALSKGDAAICCWIRSLCTPIQPEVA